MAPILQNNTEWDIRFENLTIGYETKTVLRDINGLIPGGKITTILGASGGGKSTLLRHMVGLRRPKSGKIWLGEYDLFALPSSKFRALRRRMGMMFQDGALLGSMTLAQNVGLALREHTSLRPAIVQDLVMNTLEMVGLDGAAGNYPNELSGGMRKRAGLARAMITSPPILLCDEPTSGLDPINAVQMDELLLRLKKENPSMTIVVVSHDIQSVCSIADHIIVLNDGGIAFSGSLQELESSQDPFLQRFMHRKALETNRETSRYALDESERREVAEALDAWLSKQ